MNQLTVGSQYRFRATITKDGAVWNITGATVTLHLKNPSGTTSIKSASILSATNGQVYYDSAAADLDVAGQWKRSWKISLSGVIDFTAPVQFTVVEAP
jgi:hypothetical protein